MVEAAVSLEDLVAAFRRLRSRWQGLFDGVAGSVEERESVLREIGEDLSVVTAAARVSEEAAAFIETAFHARAYEPGGELGAARLAYSAEAAPAAKAGSSPKSGPGRSDVRPAGADPHRSEARPAGADPHRSEARPAGAGPSRSEARPAGADPHRSDVRPAGTGSDPRRTGDGGEALAPALPPALAETARSLRSAFENLIRALQQMEGADDILPEAGREMRRSAARAVAFFHEVRGLRQGDKEGEREEEGTAGRRTDGVPPGEEGEGSNGDLSPPESRDAAIHRLVQSYDARRKMIREDTEVPPAAVEAVEILLRLGAGPRHQDVRPAGAV